ncbi:MAG: GAF domain-containing sensor histidine kinase [Variovorax sp.]
MAGHVRKFPACRQRRSHRARCRLAMRQPVVIDHASRDPVYRDHHTPRLYNIESYISVPIVRPNGDYFGNLCAIDPRPTVVSDARTLAMFQGFAELIALQLDNEDRQLEAESALSDARATAELREQFIAVLGHDLRNPLAAVGATAELLARRHADPDLSGIGMAFDEVQDLEGALRDVVSELREANPDRAVSERIAIDRAVRCDRGRLQQLLSNLLGNALTYGAPDRPVEVSATVEGDELVLEVANHGEPIHPENLGRVFEPYWRPHTSKPGGGLGLGLYICWQIAQAHGGEIDVKSSAAEGTAFVARLPVVQRP